MKGWITRDKDGTLFFCDGGLVKIADCWEISCSLCGHQFLVLNPKTFPDVKWTDKEPRKVKLILEVKG